MAGFIPPDKLEQIRAASDIVDVIGAVLPLKRAGDHAKIILGAAEDIAADKLGPDTFAEEGKAENDEQGQPHVNRDITREQTEH